MPKQNRLIGAASLTAAQAILLFFGYLTHLWIGRVLGPAPYGIYGVVLSLQSIIGLILSLGVPMAVSRYVAQNEEEAQDILKKSLQIQGGIGVILALATLLLAPLFSRLLNDVNLIPYIQFVAIVIFCQAFYPVYTQFLSGMHRFNKQAALTVVYAVFKLATALSLIYFYGVYGALIGFAIAGIITTLVGWHWTRKIGGNMTSILPLRSFLSFAGLYMLILLGLQVLMSIDLFMVKAFLQDDVEVGYYNAAVTLARIPYFLLQGLTFVLLPSVSALTKSNESHDAAAKFISDTLRYLIALVVPGVTFGALTASGLITLFFSAEYLPASQSLTVLMVGLGSMAFYLLLANIVAGAGQAKIGFFITLALVAISVTLGFFLIPAYGLIGAAWQTALTSIIGLIVLSAYTFHKFQIPPPFKSTLNVILASIIAVSPLYIWQVSPYLLPLQYALLGCIYILALFFLGEITKEDRNLLAKAHRRLNWLGVK